MQRRLPAAAMRAAHVLAVIKEPEPARHQAACVSGKKNTASGPIGRGACLFLQEDFVRKTLLALGAAVVFAVSAGGASADPVTITFDTLCNVVTLNTTGNNVSASFAGDSCETGLGTGYNGKVKRLGNATSMAVHFDGDPASYYLLLSEPYTTGGSWVLYTTPDGVTVTTTRGTYTVNGTAEVHPRGRKSMTSLLRH
jgi:hypothetical protein